MARLLAIDLTVRLDGLPLAGPYHLVYSVDEVAPFLPHERADDGNNTTFGTLPVTTVDTVSSLLVHAITGAIGVRVEGSESGSTAILLDAGGLVLVAGGTITSSNIKINNNTGDTAVVEGFAAGT